MASSYEREAVITRQAHSHSKSRIQVIEARIRALQRDIDVLHRQRISVEDRLKTHIQHEHDRFRELIRSAEAGPQDGPEDAGSSWIFCSSSSYLKMPPKKRTATITTTTTPMTDAQLKALISQGVVDALAERDANRSRNDDDSHDAGSDRRRRMLVARECTYSDFLKCQPLNFKESDEVEKYIGGLPDMIHGSVMASKPKTMHDAIEFETELMDQKIRTLAERQPKNKRKFKDTSRNNQNQKHPFKRHNVARAYTAGPREKKPYGGSKPLCPKCNYHHDGQCAPKCTNCKRTGHSAQDSQGHFKNNCPKLRNKNQRNQAGNGNTVARAYGVGTTGTNPNSNVITGTFLLNNRYASILFDIGANRSFVSTTFSSLIDIIPTTLDHGYDVELADDRIIWVTTLIWV
ncbi:hypothetical protein Tco_0689780 [Tanacetum coccineum]